MLEIKEKSKCSGCHACMAVCPQNCISMKHDDEGGVSGHLCGKLRDAC